MTNILADRAKAETQRTRFAEFIEDLRLALLKGTGGCAVQEGTDGKSWPCGTCVCALLESIMSTTAPEYSEHNEPVDRVNEVWRAILQIRDFDGAPRAGACRDVDCR